MVKTERITKIFFESIGGKLLNSKCVKIQTYTSQNSKIHCVNYYIMFDNKDLFGKGNFSDEIYPRYRKMRNDWKNVLKNSGIKLYSNIAVGFVPLLSSNNTKMIKKFKYQKEHEKPLGTKILSIDDINSDYYKEMAKEFNVRFALKESGGMFVGPERGMMYVLEVVCNILEKIDCFIDIGAGTGEVSAYVLKKCDPQKVVVNEISQNLKTHLKNYLKKIVKNNKIKIIFSFQDCRKIKFPSKVNLISVGVFYGVQPSFIKCKGSEIVKSLGKKGLLLIQSSMPETLFSQHILMGDVNGVNKWPWYSEKFILSNYFSCVESFFIDNQFITLASQSHDLVNKILIKLGKNVIPYANFQFSGKEKII
ncbi:MAG: hypothetical protein KJ674_05555 [Nanoarchaeota archaeon]|nr:hypothetical protein [Nanoarchaeota archaeon]